MRVFNITYQTIVTHSFEVSAFSEEGAINKAQALYEARSLDDYDRMTYDMVDCDDVTDYRRTAA